MHPACSQGARERHESSDASGRDDAEQRRGHKTDACDGLQQAVSQRALVETAGVKAEPGESERAHADGIGPNGSAGQKSLGQIHGSLLL